MLAPSIGLGALTTIAACAFLLPCRMILFRKLGWTLVLNASISLIFTYSFLAPLLLLAGPRGRSPEVEIQSEELDPDAFGLKSRGVSHGFKAQKQPEKVQLEGCRLGKSHPLGPLAPRPQNACEAELLRMWSAYPSRCQMPKAIVAERGSSKGFWDFFSGLRDGSRVSKESVSPEKRTELQLFDTWTGDGRPRCQGPSAVCSLVEGPPTVRWWSATRGRS